MLMVASTVPGNEVWARHIFTSWRGHRRSLAGEVSCAAASTSKRLNPTTARKAGSKQARPFGLTAGSSKQADLLTLCCTTVTMYHGTTREAADQIERSGPLAFHLWYPGAWCLCTP